ncbi:hypothetical protein [Sphingomonas sp. SUN039]|uniref:hypothetical protein n=1 Tax=Sphingomonas sp. SUN039 TaxID=2937787 RepID=UPI002164564B|nr:hypothetical protein [Sphingomonas sp. SUN039]UVO53521.1 hypothetical protein M0209_05080 [Sphingomonas sp. SUN039]
MNETILAPNGDPVGLTVSIAPWSSAGRSSGSADYTAMSGIASRVDTDAESLVLECDDAVGAVAPLVQLKRLMTAAAALMQGVADAHMTLTHSGVVLDAGQLETALAEWSDDSVPVHSLIAFDFATRGDPPGARSFGLAALVGQDVAAWPPEESLRLVCARMVVRLAHDMLLNGPVLAETAYPAPETPRGSVTLVPRAVPEPVVQIRF